MSPVFKLYKLILTVLVTLILYLIKLTLDIYLYLLTLLIDLVIKNWW